MTAVDTSPARATLPAVAIVSGLGAALGALLYAFIVARLAATTEMPFFGMEIYDQFFLALREGRLDLPARALRIEGHYLPDGTAHLYHGAAPLITRLALAPFVEIGSTSLAPVSLWFWGTLGTVLWHLSFLSVARRFWPEDGVGAPFWAGLLAAAVWLGLPGLLLVTNFSFYFEPIALAYAACAGFVLIWTRAILANRPLGWALLGMAVLAAVTVHARPNVAVGLYLGTGIAGLLALRAQLRKALLPALLSIAMLGAGGMAYLGLNAAKFGGSGEVHGSFEDESTVQYGMVFWQLESSNSIRARAFEDHGRFNLARVPLNLLVYGFAPPQVLADAQYQRLWDYHQKIAQERFGFIRVEIPGGGALFLWTGFVVLAFFGLIFGRGLLLSFGGPIAATGAAALLTLSYATITMRYHVDIWPLVGTLALVGLARLTPRLARPGRMARKGAVVLAIVAVGLVSTASTALYSSVLLKETPGTPFEAWNEALCLDYASAKGFDAARSSEICQPLRGAPAES